MADTLPAMAPAPVDPFDPGAAIGPVWVVEGRLGKGGMGSVYRCHNRHAPKIVSAVKLLDPSFQFHPEARSRFLREAEILSTVDHPNVVRVSNVNLDSSPPFLAMDFVDGESLEKVLVARGSIDVETAVDLATQLADALRYLHLKRIYHRDIKPANLVITPDGVIRVVDFGLAVQKGARAVTAASRVDFGTVTYCPPEWGSDRAIEPVAWDLYSTGVVFYEMLTGSVAFPSSAELPAAQQVLQVLGKKSRLQHLDPGPSFQPELRGIVQRLTARDPEARYPDAKSLLVDLEAFDPSWTAADAPRPATEPPAARIERPPQTSGVGMIKWAGLASVVAMMGIFAAFFLIGLMLVLLVFIG